MTSIEQINKEVDLFTEYTGLFIPYFSDILISENVKYIGQINKKEILNNRFILHLNKNFENYPYILQKSILWHEFTHVYDILLFKDRFVPDVLDGVMGTYSESHAESIKFRILLNFKLNQQFNIGESKNTKIHVENNTFDLSEYTKSFVTNSVIGLNSFFTSNNPDASDFNKFIKNFCYYCGFLKLHSKIEADEIFLSILHQYPQEHRPLLKKLYESIINNDLDKCSEVYHMYYSLFMNRLNILIKECDNYLNKSNV